ncbi:MAG: exodeoxyribonuclease III [Hyphomicrobiales bacterium]|nr:exodeoxyribonuclease III [Hyphomicrobiales bacterium]
MRITTWNVNSIRQRLHHLIAFLKEDEPDVLCLQEIKAQEDSFPRLEIEAAGYSVEMLGQKTFNGVAILSKHRLEDVRRGLPGDDSDEQARYLEGVVPFGSGVVRVASIYLPNGNPIGTEKYTYKLAWMDRLVSHARDLMKLEEPLVLAGDYNVIPEPRDCHDPLVWANDALFLPQTRAKFRKLLNIGLTEAVRATTEADKLYTFWDYQAGAWQKNNGIRIDHLLLSPQATDKLVSTVIHKHTRAWEKPSDHVPVGVELTG